MTKFFKNPNRGKPENIKPYVPQYQLRGLQPEQIASSTIPEAHKKMFLTKSSLAPSFDNPRNRPPPTIQTTIPYAEPVNSFLGNGDALPNSGNNIENTWTSVDGMMVDDIGINDQIDEDAVMIDNNFSDEKNHSSMPDEISLPQNSNSIEINNHEYMLIVDGELVSTGSFDKIQDEIRFLVIQHDILLDDIVVYKKVVVKMGIFIEE